MRLRDHKIEDSKNQILVFLCIHTRFITFKRDTIIHESHSIFTRSFQNLNDLNINILNHSKI